jgi:putative NADPH-quinone reductase
MDCLLIDGHPGTGRLVTHLLDHYAANLPSGCSRTRIDVRDLDFDPVLTEGYKQRKTWEPDLRRVAEALVACDHLVVAFPMWWGAEPAPLNGLLSRLLLPGFAFAYHEKDPFWDRLLAGRSADVIITMDTPALYLRFAFGNPVIKRWDKQVLGFVGMKPLRFHPLGMVKQGGVEKKLGAWEARLATAARTAPGLRRQPKAMPRLPS